VASLTEQERAEVAAVWAAVAARTPPGFRPCGWLDVLGYATVADLDVLERVVRRLEGLATSVGGDG
jgi:hypothetical protein